MAAVSAHADWALWTVWAFGLYGLVRLGTAYWKGGGRLAVHLPLFLLGAAGLVLVTETAEGARRWSADAGALPQGLRFLEGERADLAAEASAEAADGGVVLRPRRAVFFTAGEPMEGAEMSAELDLAGFTGQTALVHHVRDAQNYDFLAVEKGATGSTVRQGRVRGGVVETFDEKVLGSSAFDGGAVTLRAVAYGTHFRGYAGGELVTHGHGDAAPAGRAGLLLDGTGPLRLLRLEAVPVSE